MLQSVKLYLGKCFSIKDLGEAAFILGFKIYRDRSKRLIRLIQSAYMDKILKSYRMDNSKHEAEKLNFELIAIAEFETDKALSKVVLQCLLQKKLNTQLLQKLQWKLS
ncbi:hypothetical protein Tco_0106377 [Tanacetum coccineum]